MHSFSTLHRVRHSADDMFKLVAKVEDYPQFLPLCEAIRVRKREYQGQREVLIVDMTVAYKVFHETFTSRATIDPVEKHLLVEYLDGPFKYLENRWMFHVIGERECEIDFYIAYEFRSMALQLVMGAMFDRAFRKFSVAFEQRADEVYGVSA